jgi:hypothetical protein
MTNEDYWKHWRSKRGIPDPPETQEPDKDTGDITENPIA